MAFPEPFYRWRPHPWHGLEIGPDAPEVVNAYIEMTPFDIVKYEVDKATGYLKVDRPQRGSAHPPNLYGFIPRTYCGTEVGKLNPHADKGDGDPMDICVVSERMITRTEVIIQARVLGGLQMIDNGEADDKIVAVLDQDHVWGSATDLNELPSALIDRLRHYFSTYKSAPGEHSEVSIESTYGREEALKVVQASMVDYEREYGS